MAEIDDATYQVLTAHTDKGNELCEEERYEEAIAEFEAALALVPQPFHEWQASMWIFTGIGDCYFLMKNYVMAHQAFIRAVACPEGLGNWFIHLRLGQSHFELGNLTRAADELARAYMANGKDAFDTEDPKYYKFLKKHMKHLK